MALKYESQLQIPPLLTPPNNNTTRSNPHPVHKTLATAANLANLLPTSTVLAFQALSPSFSNNGFCRPPNKFLTSSLVLFCSIFCLLSSFTDTFKDKDGTLYYGFATVKTLYVFNCNNFEDRRVLDKYRLGLVDFVHAFVSLLVFLVFSLSNSDVQKCFFSESGGLGNALIINLPLAAGVLSSFLFTIFPSTRRGIGYADIASQI